MSAVQGLQMPTTQGMAWLLHNHTCNHNHTYTNDEYRLQTSTSSEVPREIECCNELSYLCAGSLPEHSVPLPNHHEQHTSDSVLPCHFYDWYEATTNAQFWLQLDLWHNRCYCRSATVADLANVPHLSDEGHLGLSVQVSGVDVHPLYNRFGIFTSYKGVDAEFPAQANPTTLVKPSIFRVQY